MFKNYCNIVFLLNRATLTKLSNLLLVIHGFSLFTYNANNRKPIQVFEKLILIFDVLTGLYYFRRVMAATLNRCSHNSNRKKTANRSTTVDCKLPFNKTICTYLPKKRKRELKGILK